MVTITYLKHYVIDTVVLSKCLKFPFKKKKI